MTPQEVLTMGEGPYAYRVESSQIESKKSVASWLQDILHVDRHEALERMATDKPFLIRSKIEWKGVFAHGVALQFVEPLVEEAPEQVDVIIKYPFPFDVTPQGQRFWELMEMYNPYAKIREDPESPIVIFKMLRTHYDELRKTKALISEYEPIDEPLIEETPPEELTYPQEVLPEQVDVKSFTYKVGKLTIKVTSEYEHATEKSCLIAALMQLGVETQLASDFVWLKYTSLDELVLRKERVDIDLRNLGSVFDYEGTYTVTV